MVQKIDHEKLIVTQSNRLVKASYFLTLEEKRIVLLMLSLIRRDDKDFNTYRIPVTDIRDYLGLTTNDLYDVIKRVADILMSRVLHIEEDNGGWLKVGWVSSARYIPKWTNNAEVACLDLCFSPEIKPYLLELKAQFNSYMLQNVTGLNSFYSIRIYELLNSYRRLATITFTLNELKKILMVNDKYKNYADFRIWILILTQKELLEKTDLTFNFEETRKGRKVVGITFYIHDNVPSNTSYSSTIKPRVLTIQSAEFSIPVGEQHPLLFQSTEADKETERLYNHVLAEGVQNGVGEKVMRDLLESRDPRHVMENITAAREKYESRKTKKVENLGGLTVTAITEDYTKEGREKRQQRENKAIAGKRKREAKELLEMIESSAIVTRRHDLTTQLNALSEIDRDTLKAAFVTEIEEGKHKDHMLAGYREKGWRAAGMETLFRIFAAPRLGVKNEEEYRHAEAKRLGHDLNQLKSDAEK